MGSGATQLVEQSLPSSEIRGSNPVIGKNLYSTCTVNCYEKTKKRPRKTSVDKNRQSMNGPLHFLVSSSLNDSFYVDV